MAQLASELAPAANWSSAQTRAQFFAIARLRWRITVNNFRRKGGAGELIARILVYPVLAGAAIVPTVGAGIGAYFLTAYHHLGYIAWLLWGTFLLCQFLNIQLSQPGTSFDPTQLIRFPLSVSTYTAIRLCFGLLTPANVIGTLMSFAIAFGILIAAPTLWWCALLSLAVFAAANVLFSRMIFAWVDRWLATRRAREIFTGFIFAFTLGIQYLNFTYNPAYNHGRTHAHDVTLRVGVLANLYHHAHPLLAWLPPELTTASLVTAARGDITHSFLDILGCALFALAFLMVFTLRMRTEFRGEVLSDAANVVARPKKAPVAMRRPNAATVTPSTVASAPESSRQRISILPPTLSAQFAKEMLYVRRNQGILFALVLPMAIAVFFCLKLSSRVSASYIFPAAVAYTLMGTIVLSYNSWGLEGTGSQLYFLAPVRIRDVMLGKNLMGFALAALEVVAMLGFVIYSGHAPSLTTIAGTLLWGAGTVLLNTALGNQRSLASPKRIVFAGMSRKQASPLSSLIAVLVMMIAVGFGAAVLVPAVYLHKEWIMLPVFGAYAAVALWIYLRMLSSIDRFALNHREELFAELCKTN
jgi:ABC-2 type transport system permease protein